MTQDHKAVSSAIAVRAADEPYYAALGKFIAAYALAEAGVHVLARIVVGIGDEQARVVFGGMRRQDLTERIKKLLRLRGASDEASAEVSECLDQLVAVGQHRHQFAHGLVSISERALVVTDITTAKSVASALSEAYSLELLDDLRSDCSAIWNRLTWIGSEEKMRYETGCRSEAPQLLAAMRGPWRYRRRVPAIGGR